MATDKNSDRTSFTGPPGFWKEFTARASEHGFDSASEYLRALYEMDKHYGLRPALHPLKMNRVLRVSLEVKGKGRGMIGSGESTT